MDSWNDVAIIAVMATTFMYLEQYVMDYVDGATESNFLRQLVILVIIAPLCTIWAINTLFGLGIAYTGKTWLAALVLTTILSSASRKRKG